MADLTPTANELLRLQHGHITVWQLLQAGVGQRTIERLIAADVLVHEAKRVLHLASTEVTLESRCVALCLAHPRGFITGSTGGKLVGLRRMPPEATRRPRFALPHGSHLDPIADVRLHQTTRVEPMDRLHRRDGITIARPARIAFDLCTELSLSDLKSVIEQMLQRGLCTTEDLAAMARRLARPTRAGSAKFMAALADRLPGPAADSHPEVRLFEALRRRGVPAIARQTRLRLPNGTEVRVDIAVPELRWGIEVDVHPDHLLEFGTKDKRRDRQCHLIGWQIERVTEVDLLDLEGLSDELYGLYIQRLRTSRPGA